MQFVIMHVFEVVGFVEIVLLLLVVVAVVVFPVGNESCCVCTPPSFSHYSAILRFLLIWETVLVILPKFND